MVLLTFLVACLEETKDSDLSIVPNNQPTSETEENDEENDEENNEENNEVSSEPDSNPVEPSSDTALPVVGNIYDFTLPDLNPYSASYENQITPSDYLGEVTGWYFIKAT